MSELLYDYREGKSVLQRVFNRNTAPKIVFVLLIVGIGVVFFSIAEYDNDPFLYLFILVMIPLAPFLTAWSHGWFIILLQLHDDHLILNGKKYTWKEIKEASYDWEGAGLTFTLSRTGETTNIPPEELGNIQKLEDILRKKGKLLTHHTRQVV